MRIRGVESPADVDAVCGLIAGAFEVRPGAGMGYARTCRALMEGDGAVTPDCSRVAEREGEVVGHALVIPRQMGVCGVPVPAGVVAFVAVRQDARGQGIGTALVEDATRLMRARGALVSHLAGTPAFYRRFGYVEAYRRGAGGMRPEGLATHRGGVSIREAVTADCGALQGLFERENAGRTGCVLRDAGQWAWQLRANHPGGYAACNEGLVGFRAERSDCLVAERGGEVVGYLRLLAGPPCLPAGRGRALAHEGAAADGEAAAALLARAGEVARGVRAGEVELSMPPDGSLGGWAVEQGAPFSEGLDPEALVRTLDPPALLKRLAPVLAERVWRSGMRGRSVHLWVETEGDCVGLRVTPEGVMVGTTAEGVDWQVTLPEIGLTQMVFGTRDYAAVIGGRAGADRGLTEWIAALFPAQRPHICLGDRF